MSSKDVAVSVRGVSKSYGIARNAERHTTAGEALLYKLRNPFHRAEMDTFWALKDVSFDVHKGDVVGIIGRNGAGKSTLLKILSQITEPTQGEIRLYGRVGSLLEVGTGFHPELTGRENIFLNGAILGMKRSEIQRQFDAIVDFAEIEQFLDTPVKRYSSGMYVRLAFAVAAHLNPEILIVDEVLAVGDIQFQKKCLRRMGDLTHEGSTVLFVSHNISTVRFLCNHALLLHEGMVVVEGAVGDVVERHLGTNSASNAQKVLSDKDHHTDIDKMRVKRVCLTHSTRDSFSVLWRQPISISVEVEVYKPIKGASFGAGIRTIEGIAVWSVHHDDNGAPGWDLEPGLYLIELVLQNELRPGLYKLGVGAHEQYVGHNLCYLPEAVDLEVLDVAEDDSLPVPYNAGLLNGYSEWQTPRVLRR